MATKEFEQCLSNYLIKNKKQLKTNNNEKIEVSGLQ